MTYMFKLSRRMARFRAVLPIITLFLGVACAGDPSGPGSTGDTAPTSLRISPDTVSLGVNQSVQLAASTDTPSGMVMLSRNGKGRGRPKQTIVSLAVSPQTTSLLTGTSNRFSATATLSDGSLVLPSLSWTATGGTVDSTGLFTAGPLPGAYRAIATTTNGIADTAAITITALAPVVARITMTPATTTLAQGAVALFSVIGKASDGSTVGVSPTFIATGGTVTRAGVYTAGRTAGTFRVIATDTLTSMADTAAVIITAPTATLQSVVLSPSTVALQVGGTQQFGLTGRMSDSTTAPVTGTYTATGGAITTAGLYTAGQTAGTYRVVATTAGGLADTAAVTVTAPAPTLQQVVLTPTSVSLQVGATRQFAASGKMSDGTTAPVTVTYTATGGAITGAGLYTAGTTPGTYGVTATATGSTTSGSATVTILPPTVSGECSGSLRTVNVATMAQLNTAINAALPGDCIIMAAGTYSLSPKLAITRSGTAANPITLRGPGNAVLSNGWLNPVANYWHFVGFRITGGLWGVYSDPGSFNVYDSLEVDHTDQEGIHLHGASKHNIVRDSYVHHTGFTVPAYGECVYLGSGTTNADHADSNQVLGNQLGPCSSEGIDVKDGTTGNLLQDNAITNTGTARVIGNDAGIALRGNLTQVLDNTITSTPRYGVQVWPTLSTNGNGNVFRRNTITTGSGSAAFQLQSGTAASTTRVYCDNTSIGTALGVSCTP